MYRWCPTDGNLERHYDGSCRGMVDSQNCDSLIRHSSVRFSKSIYLYHKPSPLASSICLSCIFPALRNSRWDLFIVHHFTSCWRPDFLGPIRGQRPNVRAWRLRRIPSFEILGVESDQRKIKSIQLLTACLHHVKRRTLYSPLRLLTRPRRGTRCFSMISPSSGLATGSGASSATSIRTIHSFILAPVMPCSIL